MSTFDNTSWADRAYAREYLDNASHYIPERQQLFEVLKSFYRRFISKRTDVRVCDLGCGDGVLTAELLKDNSGLNVTLVDGSTEMLEAARKRFSGLANVCFVQKSFQNLIQDAHDMPGFDLVMSAFAIHHVERVERQALFGAIFNHLRPGGHLLNIETALSADSEFTEWYYTLWQEWIESRNKRLGLEGAFLDVPRKARKNPDNKYSPLGEQLEDLEAAGFEAVECHYRNGIFAIYTGRRAT